MESNAYLNTFFDIRQFDDLKFTGKVGSEHFTLNLLDPCVFAVKSFCHTKKTYYWNFFLTTYSLYRVLTVRFVHNCIWVSLNFKIVEYCTWFKIFVGYLKTNHYATHFKAFYKAFRWERNIRSLDNIYWTIRKVPYLFNK